MNLLPGRLSESWVKYLNLRLPWWHFHMGSPSMIFIIVRAPIYLMRRFPVRMLMPMVMAVRLFIYSTLRLIASGAYLSLLMTMMILMATLRLRYLELRVFLSLHHQFPLARLGLHLVKVLVCIFHVIPAHLLLLIGLTSTPSKRDVTVVQMLIPLWLMHLHVLAVCLVVHHHILIPNR
jgi:hypothetical protein